MNAILKIEEWGDNHHPMWLDYLRILLGMTLIIKGFIFAEHSRILTNLLLSNHFQSVVFMSAQYTIIFHIAGGLLIMLGILTRFSAIMNLPVLIYAVFFINFPRGLFPFNTELPLSIIVLLLLILFTIEGDGKFSTDHFVSVHKDIW